MPQFSDDLFLGSAVINNRSPNGPSATGNPSESSLGVGPLGRVYVWDLVPLAAVANNVVNAQTTAGAGNLTLTVGTGTTAVNSLEGPVFTRLDTQRALTIQSAGNLSGVTFTVTGLDVYRQTVTYSMAGPNANTVTTGKTFQSIQSIAVSGAVGTAVNIGTSDVIGFPWALQNLGYIVSRAWNSAPDATASVTIADATSPATFTTGDPRGKYTLPSASDGTKRLVVVMAVTGIQAGPQATRAGAIGTLQV